MKVLSKSRFKIGLSCPNKLFFSGNKSYKNKEDDNTFLASLAEGGFQVEALARLSYPGGHFIDAPYGSYQKAYNQTLELLKLDEVVIYEAAFLFDGLFVMTDILVKKGNQVRLIEVKAKSFDSTQANNFIGSRGDIRSGWRPYLFDIAFQSYVAKKCVPHLHFDTFFLMADKSKVATIDGLNQMFRLPVDGDIRKDVEVKISAAEAQKTSVLSEVNVTEIVDLIIKDNYRYLIINTKNNDHFLLKTERNVSELLKNTYDITLSHMYIRRNLKNNDEYILTNDILIKMLW